MNFETHIPTQFIFGAGRRHEIARLVAGWGRRCLIVSGKDGRRGEWLTRQLTDSGLHILHAQVTAEPTLTVIEEIARQVRGSKINFIIGSGGGAVIDAAKAVAGLVPNRRPLLDYLEVIGSGRKLEHPAKPWLAVPTTGGTGAEATQNAVISVPERGVKASLRHPSLFARAAVIDPELTLSLPPSLTATTGMDALTQLIEAYVSARANPFTDALCAEGVRLVARSLTVSFHHGGDLAARTELSLAAWWSGIALAQAGLGAAHGFAAPIGGKFPDIPHGGVCAALLAPVMLANIQALSSRQPSHPALARYRDIAVWLTGKNSAAAADGVARARELVAELKIPRLSAYGITAADHDSLIVSARQASSMKSNPVELTTGELKKILTDAW
ncbi:MAG: iron-containing alcohol dehydrogenase [Verrucomicrobiales bacterium]|jgi:alcohol dehydrogenase class IV|nr:iron-containing alcohol dehydrogenase [Verrucomicrobiales bacterium]